jgi:adenylate cyclase
MAKKQTPEEFWRTQLTTHQPVLKYGRRLFDMLPSDPRCKLCGAPFAGPGGSVMRLIGRPQSRNNPNMCDTCEFHLKDNIGGIEIEIAMLFADVRGSTTLAEEMGPSKFSAMMSRFYSVASDVLVRSDAMLNYPAGDQVSGFFVPAFSGDRYSEAAVKAGLELLNALSTAAAEGNELPPVGIGVHTGVAFCGATETAGGIVDHVCLGDAVNTVARLSSAAGAGELLISDAAAAAAGLDTTGLESRELRLKGKSEPVLAWVQRISSPSAAPV